MRWSSSAALIGVILPASAAPRTCRRSRAPAAPAPCRRAAGARLSSPRLHVIEQAEAARVVEAHDRAVVERQDHMVVRRVRRRRAGPAVIRPDMPRCSSSVPLSSSSMRMYLPRRAELADLARRSRVAPASAETAGANPGGAARRGRCGGRSSSAPGRGARFRLREVRAWVMAWRCRG